MFFIALAELQQIFEFSVNNTIPKINKIATVVGYIRVDADKNTDIEVHLYGQHRNNVPFITIGMALHFIKKIKACIKRKYICRSQR